MQTKTVETTKSQTPLGYLAQFFLRITRLSNLHGTILSLVRVPSYIQSDTKGQENDYNKKKLLLQVQ